LKSKNDIQKIAIRTIETELDAIQHLIESINNGFADAVEVIYNSLGRVIITGIGKSANIALKLVSTLNSTGTPSIFMHAADAIHGDLGIIQKDDVVVVLSKSGETPEIKVLLPMIKHQGNKIIAMVGNTQSYLAKQADFVLDTTVPKEACPNNLAPTSSTTAQLVMGDALAIALLECRGFTAKDFAKYHPGGAIGKKMYLRAADLYLHNERPLVNIHDSINKVILEISSKRLGAAVVMDENNLVGIITDGDIRRMLEKHTDFHALMASDIMTENPKSVDSDTLVVDALDLMRSNNITQLPVIKNGVYDGVIHLHDILKEGII